MSRNIRNYGNIPIYLVNSDGSALLSSNYITNSNEPKNEILPYSQSGDTISVSTEEFRVGVKSTDAENTNYSVDTNGTILTKVASSFDDISSSVGTSEFTVRTLQNFTYNSDIYYYAKEVYFNQTSTNVIGVYYGNSVNYSVATVESSTATYTITNNVANTTINTTSVESGNSVTITLNCDDGYIFSSDSLPTLSYNGTTYTANYVSETQVTFDTISNVSANITVSGTVVERPTSSNITITNNVANSYLIYEPSSPVTGNDVQVSIYPNSGYYFKENEIPTLVYNGTTYTGTYITLKQIDFETIQNCTSDIEINGTVYYDIRNNVTNGTLSINPETGNSTDSITVTITANTGYTISGTPTLIYTYKDDEGDERTKTESFIVSDDNSTATITTTVSGNLYGIVNATCTLITTQSYLSFVNYYKVTLDIMKELSSLRYSYSSLTSSPTVTIVDLGEYVISLQKFYCDFPVLTDNDTEVTSDIVLGTLNTGIKANIISEDAITIDCGSITIEGKNNNTNDYVNTDIYIILPTIGKVLLDTDVYMNKTITLQYKVSLYTGSCSAILTDSDGNTLDIFNGNISDDIPYILNYDFKLQNNYNDNASLYDFNPTLYVVYRNNYNDDNTILLTENKYTQLNTLSGKCVIDHVNVTIENITNAEIDMLIDVLQNGVIF